MEGRAMTKYYMNCESIDIKGKNIEFANAHCLRRMTNEVRFLNFQLYIGTYLMSRVKVYCFTEFNSVNLAFLFSLIVKYVFTYIPSFLYD